MKNKLIEMAGKWLLGGVLREVAEGKRGPKAQAVYLAMAGKKTYAGFAMAALLGALMTYDPLTGAKIAALLGPWVGILIGAGLLDKAWRTDRPAWAGDALGWLTGLSASLSLGVTLILHVLGEMPGCDACSLWHDRLEDVAMGVGAATLWLNRFIAEPPAIGTAEDQR